MKKWLYVICPIVGIALFLALYFPAKARHEAGEAARADSIAKAKAADEAKKHEIEEKVRVDSQRRATEKTPARRRPRRRPASPNTTPSARRSRRTPMPPTPTSSSTPSRWMI
jgi:uncharacterized protein YggE